MIPIFHLVKKKKIFEINQFTTNSSFKVSLKTYYPPCTLRVNNAVLNFSARNHALQDQISCWESKETSFFMKRNKNEFNNSQQFHGQHSVILKSCSSKFSNYLI